MVRIIKNVYIYGKSDFNMIFEAYTQSSLLNSYTEVLVLMQIVCYTAGWGIQDVTLFYLILQTDNSDFSLL